MLGQSDNILLKTLVKKLGMTPDEVENLDFRPAKITTMSGHERIVRDVAEKPVPGENAETDELKGVRIVFSMTADKLYEYETVYKEIVRRGGMVSYRVRGSKYFVVRELSQLDTDKFDLRIAALKTRAGRNVQVITFKDLKAILGLA